MGKAWCRKFALSRIPSELEQVEERLYQVHLRAAKLLQRSGLEEDPVAVETLVDHRLLERYRFELHAALGAAAPVEFLELLAIILRQLIALGLRYPPELG